MSPRLFLSIGEPMVELGRAAPDGDLWRMGFAGDVLNTLWYARACLPRETEDGGWETALLTRVGLDPFSQRMLEFLEGNGIATNDVARDPARSIGLYAIELSPAGERRFAYWRSHSAARLLADDAAALSAAMARADLVYFSGITLAILDDDGRRNLVEATTRARDAGKITVFDPNIRPVLWEDESAMRKWLRAGCAAASIGLPSFDDEARVWGDAAPEECVRRWFADGAGEVVVKNAGGPIAVARASDDIRIMEVGRVVPIDTTGAGDAFNGGYLAARLTGDLPFAAAAKGHALAVRVTGHRGALIPMDDIG